MIKGALLPNTGTTVTTMIYLDNSATTRVCPEAVAAAEKYMTDAFFNPSGAYTAAVAVERDMNAARRRIAAAMGVPSDEVYFTSGGTEGNNMAVFGSLAHRRARGRVLLSGAEHPSVFDLSEELRRLGFEVITAPVDSTGACDLERLRALVTADTAFVSVMHVNNETGAINSIEAVNSIVKAAAPDAVFHADGVQGFLKAPQKLACDIYTASGHKLHAPKGTGAIYVSKRIRFSGGQIGGGQEHGIRSGTENVPGIMAFDAAVAAFSADRKRYLDSMMGCKLRLAERLTAIDGAVVNGPEPRHGAPHILNVSFMGVRGEVLLHALAEQGIMVSTGSACSSKKKGSRVLREMGLSPDRQESAIRFSLSRYNTLEEADAAAAAVESVVTRLRRYKRR